MSFRFSKPATPCQSCPLHRDGSGYVPRDGHAINGVLLVGDSASEADARLGRPFSGPDGFYLDRVLRRAGLDRTTFAIQNVLSCQGVSDGSIRAEAVQRCAPFLDATIRNEQPKVIVAFGNLALQRLTKRNDIARHRGFVLTDEGGRFVVPTYHPRFLVPRIGQANTSRFAGVVIRDLRRAVRIARDGFSRMAVSYTLDPPPHEFAGWVSEFEAALAADPALFLSFDIETPYKQKRVDEDDLPDDEEGPESELPLVEPILRISFAYREGHAVTVPWDGRYLPLITRILATAGNKIGWNCVRFDVPIIEAHGVAVCGPVLDMMWAFHMWQSDLPKGLEFAASLLTDLEPWKHESESRPIWYSAVDADAQLRCALALQQEMTAVGQWNIFLHHVVTLDPLLMQMGNRGVRIDTDAQNALRVELETLRDDIMRQVQDVVPDKLRPRTEYKRLPKDPGTRQFEPRLITTDIKVCSHCGQPVSNKTEHLKGGKKSNPCAAAEATLVKIKGDVVVYDEVGLFNPNSVQHLIAYATDAKHPIGTNYKTQHATLDKKAVTALDKQYGHRHPVYGFALRLRGVRKTLGTYVDGFKPDGAGLIYTTFGHHPSSGRLSSRKVNLQNVSHRGGVAYADRVRRTIVPRPGHVFVEADSSAIEAVMTGYFMGSAEYIALAKEGIHDYLTCLEVDIPFTPEAITLFKGTHGNALIYKAARDRNKQVVHGTSYGMTPYLMHMTYKEIFPRIKDADEAQQRFFAACPGLKVWQHETRVRASKQTYLENPWHYRHYFYNVFDGKDQNGNYTLGEDGKRAVSYLPQSSAAAFMKDNIILLSQSPFWPMPSIGVIHDSYTLEVPAEREAEAADLLVQVLTRPIPEMGGLTIGCEVKRSSTNWNELETLKKVA